MKPIPPYLRVKFGEEVWHDKPYDENPPDFFDRASPKKQALAILNLPGLHRAIWLFGERRSGKTSMLKLLIEYFRAQEGFIAIEVPWQSIHSSEDFYKEFLYQFDIATGSDINLSGNQKVSFWEALHERQLAIGQHILVVGIDEIDSVIMDQVTDENSKKEILGSVLRLVTQEPNVKVILTSARSSNKIEQFKASPLVSKSEEISVQPFSEADMDELIYSIGTDLSKTEMDHIRSISGGWPYYAKAILYHILQFPPTDSHRLRQACSAAAKSISQTCDHLYRHHWNNDEQRALWLLANKEIIQPEEFNQLDISLRTALRELTERGYIIEEDTQYRFRVALIADWLRTWTRREFEEERLEIPSLLKKLSNPWTIEPGEQHIQITKEDLRLRGF